MEYKETASPVSYFETGMMGMQHWQGAWIGDGKDIHYGPAPYFRKEFKTGKKVKSQRVLRLPLLDYMSCTSMARR